jgi:hypothetical protein
MGTFEGASAPMMRCSLPSCLSLLTCVAVALLPMEASAYAARRSESSAPEQPGPPTPAAEDPLAQPDAPQGPEPASAAEAPVGSGTGPLVHVINEMPDDDRGLVKLARYRNTTTQAGGNVIVVTTNYDEICTEPCGVAVDVTDRPIFFFVRDGSPVSYGFRLKGNEELTLSLRPLRGKMRAAGFVLVSLFIYPAGIPLMLLGRPKVSIAPGAPSPAQDFRKLKKAKQ